MPKTPRTAAQLRGFVRTCAIYTALSLLAVGFSAYRYVRLREFIAHATHVQGKIAGNVRITSSKHSDHFTAIFTFTDAAGKNWEVRDRASNYQYSRYVFKAPCSVLYDPGNPADARLETSGSYFDLLDYEAIPGFLGVIFGFISIWCLIGNYAELRRLRAAGGDGTIPRDPAILEGS